VRVSAQLVEAASGNHVWADRMDGELHDIFDLQDKIVANVVGALEPQLLRVEVERIHQKRPENFDAYDLTLCGLARMNKLNPEDTAAALDYFRRATDADPNYARAYCCASWCYRRQVQLKGMILSEKEKAEAVRLARAALQADNTDPYVLWQVGMTVALVEQDLDAAQSLIDRSLTANPNSNRAWLASATVRTYIGDPVTAIEHAERAMQLSPLDTAIWVAFGLLANAHIQLTNYEDAAVWARRSVQLHRDNLPAHLDLIISLALTGQQQEAETALTELHRMEPYITLASVQQRFPMNRYQNLQSFIEGLSKAGLPA
jgi:tetratricopeptide (TPR) repeat protein